MKKKSQELWVKLIMRDTPAVKLDLGNNWQIKQIKCHTDKNFISHCATHYSAARNGFFRLEINSWDGKVFIKDLKEFNSHPKLKINKILEINQNHTIFQNKRALNKNDPHEGLVFYDNNQEKYIISRYPMRTLNFYNKFLNLLFMYSDTKNGDTMIMILNINMIFSNCILFNYYRIQNWGIQVDQDFSEEKVKNLDILFKEENLGSIKKRIKIKNFLENPTESYYKRIFVQFKWTFIILIALVVLVVIVFIFYGICFTIKKNKKIEIDPSLEYSIDESLINN